MRKLYVYGIVAILIIAGIALIYPKTGAGNGDIGGKMNVFVENVDTGEIGAAEVDIGDASSLEQFVMSMGGGIRLQPFALWPGDGGGGTQFNTELTGISASTNYKLWITASITLTATNLDSTKAMTSYVIVWGACPIGTAQADFAYAQDLAKRQIRYDNNLVVGTNNIDTSTVGKYQNVYNTATVTWKTLQGSNLDGAIMWLASSATGTDMKGNSITKSVMAGLTIHVNWATGTMSMDMTSMGAGTGL